MSGNSQDFDRNVTRKFLELDNIMHDLKKLRFSTAASATKKSFLSWKDSDGAIALQVLRLRTFFRDLVKHRFFSPMIAILILLNAVFIGIETDLDNSNDFSLDWYFAELAFTLLFLAEFLVRCLAARHLREFACDSWNIFDFFLVCISCLDSFLVTFLSRSNHKTAINTFQAVRLVRMVRMFRLLRFFHEMWVLVAGIVEAMWTLFWTWVLLLVIIYVCGIFATRTIGQPHRSDSEAMDRYFGNLPRSMFTLFQITTTEGWADIAREAMKKDAWTAIFFVIYLYVTTCAVLNVVVAVIVENTLDQAGEAREKFNAKHQQSQKVACAKMYQIYQSLDSDGDGTLEKAEYMQALENEQITTYLHQLGIDMRQAEELFSILDFDESGSLDAQEFVGGVIKAAGPGKARDVLALHCDLWRAQKKVTSKVKKIYRETNCQIKAVRRGVKELRVDVRRASAALAEVKLRGPTPLSSVAPPQGHPQRFHCPPDADAEAWVSPAWASEGSVRAFGEADEVEGSETVDVGRAMNEHALPGSAA